MGWMQQVETVALASATFRSVPWGRELLQHLEPQNIALSDSYYKHNNVF